VRPAALTALDASQPIPACDASRARGRWRPGVGLARRPKGSCAELLAGIDKEKGENPTKAAGIRYSGSVGDHTRAGAFGKSARQPVKSRTKCCKATSGWCNCVRTCYWPAHLVPRPHRESKRLCGKGVREKATIMTGFCNNISPWVGFASSVPR
jgi:hypothetical protein